MKLIQNTIYLKHISINVCARMYILGLAWCNIYAAYVLERGTVL
jgi:hypothetical protein